MKTPAFSLIAPLLLALSACTHQIDSHLTTNLLEAPYRHVGIDLHAPAGDQLFHDGKSFYFIAPVVTYNRHTPLIEATRVEEKSPYPAIQDVQAIPNSFLIRVTPGKVHEGPKVTLWLHSKNILENISLSKDKKTYSLRVVGEKSSETIEGLTLYNVDKSIAKEFFRKMNFPHYAQIGPDTRGWKKTLAYTAIPLSVVTSLLDTALELTANTAEAVVMTPVFLARCCYGAQQQHFKPGENKEAPEPQLVDAEVIQH